MILRCLAAEGTLFFSPHALKEMEKDGITIDEARSVLRSGVVEGHDLIRGTWRYRVRRTMNCVVVAFDSETLTIVVTAWRKE